MLRVVCASVQPICVVCVGAHHTHAQFSFPSPYWDPISPQAKDFISKLLVKEPSERLSASQAVQHPWLKSAGSRISLPSFRDQMQRYVISRKRESQGTAPQPPIGTSSANLAGGRVGDRVLQRPWKSCSSTKPKAECMFMPGADCSPPPGPKIPGLVWRTMKRCFSFLKMARADLSTRKGEEEERFFVV